MDTQRRRSNRHGIKRAIAGAALATAALLTLVATPAQAGATGTAAAVTPDDKIW